MIASKVYVIHENQRWTDPLTVELEACSVPYELWFLDEGMIDLSAPPPPGIFYSRMSASSHTRDHRFAAEYTGCVLRWLETHERVVLNGSRALRLEISKVAQYTALETSGIRTPRTLVTVGSSAILQAASQFNGSFITKHNRGGKGLGVYKFDDVVSLRRFIESPNYEAPVDGVTLIQAYIESPQPFITRCEFVGGKFLYAVKVNTASGFELCPADVCEPTAASCSNDASARFQIVDDFADPLIADYERFLRANEIDIAGIEFIVDIEGNAFTYDINTNTNYNASAEALSGRNGMAAIANRLADLLAVQVAPPASLRFAG